MMPFRDPQPGYQKRVSGPDTPDPAGTVEIPGAPGWRYQGIDQEGDRRVIGLLHESGFRTSFEVPDFVRQGEEIGQIARIVAGAWERQEALKGVGG
jgi:hypothetical protein